MWSLYRKKGEEERIGLDNYSLEIEKSEKLEPLKFSNGKTQEDVVREVIDAIKSGKKTIFIRGVCGSGKSAMALNIAKQFKSASIVVPIKSLQEQYERDYTREKFILKDDKNKLKISVIKGRNNFRCPFSGERADGTDLPCSIEIRERNMEQLKKYIEMNDNVDKNDFNSIEDVRRMSVAPACPYWSPLLPSGSKALSDAKKKKYISVNGTEYSIFQRKKGCMYYDQYEAYADSDVLIFNSQKYLLELAMGRKPKTEIDIIDECDEFLDNYAQERKINLTRLISSLNNIAPNPDNRLPIKDLIFQINEILFNYRTDEVEKIEKTKVKELLKTILENYFIAEDDEDSYFNSVLETARLFEDLLDETYVSFSREGRRESQSLLTGGYSNKENIIVTIVTINLARQFNELLKKVDALVLMSGTIHSENVLKDIFGLQDFKIIDAETASPGNVIKCRTGNEKNCKYENFMNGMLTRKQYLTSLHSCVKSSKTPTLIHVNSFEDLPSNQEKIDYELNFLPSKEQLIELQNNDKTNREIDRFKSGANKMLFTTKCSRGVDFPGEQCNSIIVTKYPYPNIKSMFWQILKKEKPHAFREFYMDKARRELLQKVYRGVRYKGDQVILISPDSRVLDEKFN